MTERTVGARVRGDASLLQKLATTKQQGTTVAHADAYQAASRTAFSRGKFSREYFMNVSKEKRGNSGELTLRERTIVRMVAEGFSNKEISARLNLSVKTTETHRAAAMGKLAVSSTAGLVRYAVRENLLPPE